MLIVIEARRYVDRLVYIAMQLIFSMAVPSVGFHYLLIPLSRLAMFSCACEYLCPLYLYVCVCEHVYIEVMRMTSKLHSHFRRAILGDKKRCWIRERTW